MASCIFCSLGLSYQIPDIHVNCNGRKKILLFIHRVKSYQFSVIKKKNPFDLVKILNYTKNCISIIYNYSNKIFQNKEVIYLKSYYLLNVYYVQNTALIKQAYKHTETFIHISLILTKTNNYVN